MLIALRWALFTDLSILFGLPLLLVFVSGQGRGARYCAVPPFIYGTVACAGIIASLAGFLWQAAAMAGTTPSDVDTSLLSTVVLETSLGWALIARIAVLAAVGVVIAVPAIRARGRGVLIGVSALALATLAWSGHGAADEGLRGWIHLGTDIVHLLAAGAWVGALVGFVWLVGMSKAAPDNWSDLTHHALAAFATMGTVLVGSLVVTGVLNFYFIVGFESWTAVAATTYGQLLLMKLILFAAMLVLAAVNRFNLTPALGIADSGLLRGKALRRLRRSLVLELSLALAVVALVAWFGTLSPQGPS